MMGPNRAIREIAATLKNNPDISVVIKPGDTTVDRWTEKKLLSELQKALACDGRLFWWFPKSGGMVVELDRFLEVNDG